MNKVFLIGRLTKDPEIRYTTNGTAVTSFTIAINRKVLNQQGEREADFIPIIVWSKTAENCHKYLAKGRQVAVAGRIQTGSYDGKDGTKHYTTEVVAEEVQFLDRAPEGEAPKFSPSNVPKPDASSTKPDFPGDLKDDELPF